MKNVFDDFQKRRKQEERDSSGKKEEQKNEKGEDASGKALKEFFPQLRIGSSRRRHEVGESSKPKDGQEESLKMKQKVEKGEEDSSKKMSKLFRSFGTGRSKRMQEVGQSSMQREASSKKKTSFFSRLRIGSSRRKQEQGESSKPKEVREDGVDEDHPFGFDEFRNYLARNCIPYPDEERYPDPSVNNLISSHPIYFGTRFEWQDVLAQTSHRSLGNLLTQGAYGKLYRCVISETNSVAVKFQDPVNSFAHEEFMADFKTLQRANHENVVKLLGKSFGRDEVALLYDIMPRGTLDQHLFGSRPGEGFGMKIQVLNWEMRMNIAVGVAEALAYLHTELQVIHRDVKIEDVLLDQEFKPKLANFDLAVDMVIGGQGDENDWVISPPKGTPGCLAPETEALGTISSKCDVYGYGVLLFQLFTGMKAQDFSRPLATRNLTDLMMQYWSGEEYVPQMIDAKICKRYSVQGLDRIYEVARMCTDPRARYRPNMKTVVKMVHRAAAEDVQEFPKLTKALILG